MEVRDKVISTLKTEFPRLRSVQPHGGPLDLEELKRFTLRVPAVRVAWVGTTLSRDKIQKASGASTFAVYIICKDRPGKPAPDQIARISEQITTFLDGNQFGLNYIGSARVHSTENKYSSEQDITGTAIAEIRFECPMILETDTGDTEPEYPDNQRAITIYKRTMGSTNVGSVEAVNAYTLIHTEPEATVKTLGGLSEMAQVAMNTANATHEISIPYVNLGIDLRHIVKIGSKVFDIKSCENVDEANRVLILRCAYRGLDTQKAN